ncbi:uncharacterized protein LOC118434571 [Folsomia candida]|uniref:uncharacterized protein LOC118434571 n=1 Tax=Folsomia candida TaxID=158441 RepID=UPI001605183D|nr:uncharacterized protein LOC118434571 [Folsomia candida]
MLGLLKSMDWDNVKSPILFVSGMLVGVILVAIIWYIVQVRKAHEKRQLEKEEGEQDEGDSEVDPEGENYPSAIIVADAKGDYLLEDKSQLGGIIDFKKVPRRESERQAARRELVITMLIAESMSK